MKHGHFVGDKPSLTYSSWDAMIGRCERPANASYPAYGAKGIKVCRRWRESFEAFLADMGPRPSKAHQIERKDGSMGYEPGNCIWATVRQQARNRSSNRKLTFQGETLTAIEWAERKGFPYQSFVNRITRGWSVERALTTPIVRRTH